MQGNDLGLRQHPDAQSFAALTHEQQIAFLTQVERTPFFERVRLDAARHVCAAEIRRQSQPRSSNDQNLLPLRARRLGPIAGTGFADWPISYAELEPLLHVS
jgi:chromosome condensin MukBEF ATPase and DNA-binding subunit MukB